MNYFKTKKFLSIFVILFIVSIFTAEAKSFSVDFLFKKKKNKSFLAKNKIVLLSAGTVVMGSLLYLIFKQRFFNDQEGQGAGVEQQKAVKKGVNSLTGKVKKPNVLKRFVNSVKIKLSGEDIFSAVKNENLDLVRIMIENGADVNQFDWRGSTLVKKTISHKKADMLELLVHNGADVDLMGERNCPSHWSFFGVSRDFYYNPLCAAIFRGVTVGAKNLIDNGADVNQVEKDGYTALHLACNKGENLKIAEYLLDHGADVNKRDHNRARKAPIHVACLNQNRKCVRLLIENGADVNKKDCDGNTPLHIACKEGNFEIVQLLIESGADPNETNTHRKTPLEEFAPLVGSKNYRKIFDCLVNGGADLCGNLTYFVDHATSVNHHKLEVLDRLARNIKTSVRAIHFFVPYIKNKKTVPHDRQTGLLFLLDGCERNNVSVDQAFLIACISKIEFNNRFFKDPKFKKVRTFAFDHGAKDRSGRTVLQAVVKFLKNSPIFMDFLTGIYEEFSYAKDDQKDSLTNEFKTAVKEAKKSSKKFYATLSNIDIIWDDFTNKNLFSSYEKLEPAHVRKIFDFVGIEGFKRKKIYYN